MMRDPWRIIAQVPASRYPEIKAAIIAAGGRVWAGYRDDGTDSEPSTSVDPDTVTAGDEPRA